MMRDEERQFILKQVNGSAPDCALVCQVLRTVQRNGQAISYGVRVEDDGSLLVRLGKNVGMFSSAQARGMFALSLRVEHVSIRFDKPCVEVRIVRDGETAQMSRRPWTAEFPRAVHVDYVASRITDADDIRVIDGIVAAVYSAAERMPSTLFWFEPIVHAGGWADTNAAAAAAAGDDDDDASESSTGARRAPETARLGYSLCFANVPTLSATFFDHLTETYGQRVASAYAWFGVAAGPPLLVVNVRRAAAPAGVLLPAVKEHVPRPLPVAAARAGDKRRDTGGGDDGSETVSNGERRSKRVRGGGNDGVKAKLE